VQDAVCEVAVFDRSTSEAGMHPLEQDGILAAEDVDGVYELLENVS
jgi:hypothetical protein